MVQNSIRTRMKSYPKDWSNLTHYTHIMVPRNMKYVLENCPKNLISKAIRLFYYRDHIDIKTCRLLKKINPKSENLSLVKIGLNLTKCLYAMLNKVKTVLEFQSIFKSYIHLIHTVNSRLEVDLALF